MPSGGAPGAGAPGAGGGGALEWEAVRYELPGGRGAVLRGVGGCARRGRLTAVLGPSGSGKTTLLRALAGTLPRNPGARLRGRRYCEPGPPPIYVPQEASFFSCLTVRETLDLAARLRDPSLHVGARPWWKALTDPGDRRRDAGSQAVDGLLFELGLKSCAETLVGGDTGGTEVVGISGGEKRRLSIAVELAGGEVEGRVVILDEPTSGLDAFQADRIVDLLASLAHESDCAVLCSLHQPRSASVNRIDDILLLSPGGRVAYEGEVDAALRHFEALGYTCPPNYNPAEFLVDLVSIDTSSKEAEEASLIRLKQIQAAWKHLKRTGSGDALPTGFETPVRSCSPRVKEGDSQDALVVARENWRQFRLLFGRCLKQTSRDKWTHVARSVASVALAVCFGITNHRLGNSQKSIKSRASLMFQTCITTAMMSIVKSLNSFPRERVTVARELERGGEGGGTGSSGGYRLLPYFLSKICVETPVEAMYPVLFGAVLSPIAGLNAAAKRKFLAVLASQSLAASGIGLSIGALCPTVDTALALGPCVMVLNILLADQSGMFAEIPDFMKPLSNFSVIRWGFEGCMAAEMEGLEFTIDATAMPKGLQMPPPGVVQQLRSAAMKLLDPTHTSKAREAAFAEPYCLTTGGQVLEGLGIAPADGVRPALAAGLKIFAANTAVAYAAMRAQGRDDGFRAQMLEKCSEPFHVKVVVEGQEGPAGAAEHETNGTATLKSDSRALDSESDGLLQQESGTDPESESELEPPSPAPAPATDLKTPEKHTPGGTRILPMNLHYTP